MEKITIYTLNLLSDGVKQELGRLLLTVMLTLGLYMWMIPSAEPGSVMPRMKKIVSTAYGKIDVKYTTWIEQTLQIIKNKYLLKKLFCYKINQ